MSETPFTVDDVKIGEKDLTESEIVKIYTKIRPDYAVYRTHDRVAVQFADEEKKAEEQRKKMATLNLLRVQIAGLIDGWSRSKLETFKARARKYERRLATGLILCLEDDPNTACASLEDTKADIEAERKSWGRFEYLIAASIVSALAIAAFTFAQRHLYTFHTPSENVWLAARAGTVGAFFSIALAIQDRSVLTNLHRRDNFADATLRVVIGMIAAGVLLLALGSKLVTSFKLGDANISGPEIAWQTVVVIGFVAGFVERLVPDLLKKTAAQDASAEKIAADKAEKAATEKVAKAAAGKIAADKSAAEKTADDKAAAEKAAASKVAADKAAAEKAATPNAGGDKKPTG